MKLRDLIDELTRISAEFPDADVDFQTVDMASEWFDKTPQALIAARITRGGSCTLTLGPNDSIASDYKRVADRQEQARK